jgi:hypothetical protein
VVDTPLVTIGDMGKLKMGPLGDDQGALEWPFLARASLVLRANSSSPQVKAGCYQVVDLR